MRSIVYVIEEKVDTASLAEELVHTLRLNVYGLRHFLTDWMSYPNLFSN